MAFSNWPEPHCDACIINAVHGSFTLFGVLSRCEWFFSRSLTLIHALSPWTPSLKKTMTRKEKARLCSDGIVVKYMSGATGETKVPRTRIPFALCDCMQ